MGLMTTLTLLLTFVAPKLIFFFTIKQAEVLNLILITLDIPGKFGISACATID